jgi:hypothetical protein
MGICKCDDEKEKCSVHISRHTIVAKLYTKDKYTKKLNPCKCDNCSCDDHKDCDCDDCDCCCD